MGQKDNNLKIGAARVKVDIPDNFFPYESFRNRVIIGEHDDLYARCIIIGNSETSALILSLELGDLGDNEMWQEKISRATGVPVENILITVTHTHESPHVSDDCAQPLKDEEKSRQYGECVMKATMEAVKEAKTNMKPGRISYGSGTCNINVNRDYCHKGRYIQGPNPHGPSDKTVAVMKFEDMKGNVIAYMYNYAVHGCVMFWNAPGDGGMLIGGDIPGETSRYIEKRHDDKVVALYTLGTAGDQLPKYMAKRFVFDSKGDIQIVNVRDEGYLLVQVMAEELADEVLLVAKNMKKSYTKAVIKGIQKKVIVPGQKKLENQDLIDSFEYEDGDPVKMHLSLLLIDHVALVGIPGELVCNIGTQIKETIPYKNVVVITQCNGSVSYISDEEGYEKRTFQATASHIKKGWPEKALIQGTEEMFDALETD